LQAGDVREITGEDEFLEDMDRSVDLIPRDILPECDKLSRESTDRLVEASRMP
jgi:hypothetical protein